MEIVDILKQLEFYTGVFPREAMEAAVAQKEEITPELLKILEEVSQNPQKTLENESYMAHVYAMFLLAQFRDTRAYPLLATFFSTPGDEIVDNEGDLVTEDWGNLLASVYDGDIAPIAHLIEDKSLNEYARGAGLHALVTLWVQGLFPREDLVTYFRSLFREKLERKPAYVWDLLVSHCADVHPAEWMDEIRQTFAEDLAVEGVTSPEDVEEALAKSPDEVLQGLKNRGIYNLVEDAVDEMPRWASFQPTVVPEAPKLPNITVPARSFLEAPSFFGDPLPPKETVPFKAPEKVGRNEPCPCGSGKKYKACCGSGK